MKRLRAIHWLFPFVLAGAAWAQQPGVELTLASRVLELGEAVDAQLVCTNTGLPSQPQASASDGLEIRLSNTAPFTSQQMSIVNGRRSQRTTYTFGLRITAVKEGEHTLGPFLVEADGQTFQTQPVTITVRKSQVSTGAKGDQSLFVELEVVPRTLYVTQTYTATLTIGIRKPEFGARTQQLEYLRQVLDIPGSQLSIFEGGSARQSEIEIADAQGVRHGYMVYRVTKEMQADGVGEVVVGPIFLRANYPLAVRESFFGRLEITKSRRETARADAVAIQIKGPPAEGRPESFDGAVGNYSMNVSVKPARLEQGQPVTLSISLRGAPLDGLAGPDLTHNAELASRFDFTSDELVGDVENGAKVFRRAIFPKQAGEQTVPAIHWSFFDPKAERYVALTSESIPIVVDMRSQSVAPLTLAPGATEAAPQRPQITVLQGGLSPNYVDEDGLLATQRQSLGLASCSVGILAPPVLCGLTLLGLRHRERVRGDRGYARRRGAARRADVAIRNALMASDPSEQVAALGGVLSDYLGDRFDRPVGTTTPTETRALLLDRGFSPEFADAVSSFLEVCDGLRYSPQTARQRPAAAEAERIRGWLQTLEAEGA